MLVRATTESEGHDTRHVLENGTWELRGRHLLHFISHFYRLCDDFMSTPTFIIEEWDTKRRGNEQIEISDAGEERWLLGFGHILPTYITDIHSTASLTCHTTMPDAAFGAAPLVDDIRRAVTSPRYATRRQRAAMRRSVRAMKYFLSPV